MSLAAVRKWRASLPGCHAACNQGTGRAAGVVTAHAFSAGVPPALQPVTSFALSPRTAPRPPIPLLFTHYHTLDSPNIGGVNPTNLKTGNFYLVH